jgi:very-short-patch-repair endonuclease
MQNKPNHDPNPSGVVFLQRVGTDKILRARELRKKMTLEECMFWECVRDNRFMGLQFRRQQIIEGFFADFYCNKARCVVEIDGGFHETYRQKKYDAHRRKVFENRGLTEIRFKNQEIRDNLSSVMDHLGMMILRKMGKVD